VQIGRGKISLADAYLHSYQESKVPIVTPVGKHAGEVEIFFAFASKEVSDTLTVQVTRQLSTPGYPSNSDTGFSSLQCQGT
jgi:hypothetical protein